MYLFLAFAIFSIKYRGHFLQNLYMNKMLNLVIIDIKTNKSKILVKQIQLDIGQF